LDLWKLVNFGRNELSVEYAIVHPQLCVTDGDNFWRDMILHFMVGQGTSKTNMLLPSIIF